MIKKPLKKAEPDVGPLPRDPAAALRELIRLTKGLRDMAEQETQALVTNNMLPFAFLQMEKEKLAQKYQVAADAFRSRLEEFRGCDPALLKQLDTLQGELRDKSEANNVMVDQIRRRSLASTMESLFIAQELGQQVEWPAKPRRPDGTQNNDGRV